MSILYRIKNWQDLYENNRTRDLKKMLWVPIPVKLSGDGYCLIMEDKKNGPAIFGTFISIIELAACCIPRGDLVRSSGEPHDFGSIGRICRISCSLIEMTISYCVDILKWIEIIELNNDCGKTAQRCGITAEHVSIPVLSSIPSVPVPDQDFDKAKHAKRSIINGNTAFEICGTKITYGFYGSILKACAGDIEMAGRVFFRAKCRATQNPVAWISAGMMLKDGERYALKSIREEDEDPQAVRQWIDSVVNHYEDTNK